MKYGRTPHLPWSPGKTKDDRHIKSLDAFGTVVITEKMDGENSTIHRDGCFARSVDSKSHYSRDWLKQFAASFQYRLLPGERIIGENMYAMHSIYYDSLPSWFLGFAIIFNGNFLSWEDTLIRFTNLGITPVPQIYVGPFNLINFKQFYHRGEGYVVRNASAFKESDMHINMAKYVRKDHVQTSNHWMHQSIVVNGRKQ